MKRVSIVVPTLNYPYAAEHIKEYLQKADYKPFEMLVIADEGVGYAKAVNKGFRAATGDLVVLISDNNAVEQGWLKSAVEQIGDETVFGTMGTHTDGFGTEMATTWFSIFPRSLLTRVGFLDEGFDYFFDDNDYCRRLKQAGVSLKVIKGDLVRHPESEKGLKSLGVERQALWDKSQAYFKEKWKL